MNKDVKNRGIELLGRVLACPPPKDNYFGYMAIVRLAARQDLDKANEELRHVAGWFDRPHPQGRHIRGESDFASIKLALALAVFDGELLESSTRDAIRRFFTKFDFSSIYKSENHLLLFLASRLIAAGIFPEDSFEAFGKTGRELVLDDTEKIKQFINYRIRRGWGEFDSPCYLVPDVESLSLLYRFAEDPLLRKLAQMSLDVLFADIAQETLNTMYGGAHGRIYPPMALDHAGAKDFYSLQYLYFGNVGLEQVTSCVMAALLSGYDVPESIRSLASLPVDEELIILERKHLHNTEDILPVHPLSGSIYKYTCKSADYIAGCVMKQDSYPRGHDGAGYAGHQQHNWDVTLNGGSTRSRIFTHHPGDFNEHNYWTGDLCCNCGEFFQNRSAVLAFYNIPAEQPFQFIHAYLPENEFERVEEENGIIFAATRSAAAALILPNGYEWTRQGEWADRELTSPGAINGAICEAASLNANFTFEDFRLEIFSNSWSFDKTRKCISYNSKRCGRLRLGKNGLRELDGRQIEFNYPLYQSKYINSEWDSGITRITVPGFPPLIYNVNELQQTIFNFFNDKGKQE